MFHNVKTTYLTIVGEYMVSIVNYTFDIAQFERTFK
jgi:hypothetical protein